MKLTQTAVLTWWFDIRLCFLPGWCKWPSSIEVKASNVRGILYRTITSIIGITFIWDSWILHLYVGGKYAYLPLSLFFLMEYFYHKNVSPGHHQDGDVGHSPLQFPSQESHLTTIYRQDIIVKTLRTQWWVWSIPHPGPQRLRKTTIEGKRSGYSPSTSPLPRAGTNVTQKEPLWAYGFSSWKERPQGEYPVSEYCRTLSGKASWVLPQVDHRRI